VADLLMTDRFDKAFDFAQDTTKQIVTLASGIIAITLTFLNGRLTNYPSDTRTWLEVGWALYLVSVLFGIVTLMALSGNLERPGTDKTTNKANEPSIYRCNIRGPSILQVLLFLAATVARWYSASRQAERLFATRAASSRMDSLAGAQALVGANAVREESQAPASQSV